MDLGLLWSYRELLAMLALRDVQVRYKQTLLGAAWAIVQPVGLMIVITLLRQMIGLGGPSDPVLVFAALLPWTFFASAVNGSTNSLVTNAHMLRKVYFPRLVLPLASLGAPLLDLGVALGVLMVLMSWYGLHLGAGLLLMIPLTITALVVATGVGVLLSAATVFYRDFRHIVPLLLQVWFFLTPVIYTMDNVPPRYQWLVTLNPMTGVIEGFRAAAMNQPVDLASWGCSAIAGTILLTAGVAYFNRVQAVFADAV
ncbi:MAG: ABC transporter permease [Phycisphaeraceae bacterium]|nr:ABC transporter permease [Phycisphaeraceae bacterium]